MDEPLSNLDAKLRVQTRTQIAELQRRLGVTTVYVTHDQVEAMTMGDRVAVMLDGVLQQVDTPRALYESPANVFVAGFIGSPAMSLTPAAVNGDTAEIGGYQVKLARGVVDKLAGAKSVALGVRPEDMVLGTTGIEIEVDLVEELGADAYLYGHTTARDNAKTTNLIVRVGGDTDVKRGQIVKAKPNKVYVFEDSPTGRRLD
jgi:multiple sugar transport system ATP-binding protein